MNVLVVAQLLINAAEIIENACHRGLTPKELGAFNQSLRNTAQSLTAQKEQQPAENATQSEVSHA